MWDDVTESLWQQISGEAIVGELTGTVLEQVPALIVRWSDFRAAHPNGKVLSQETGFDREYGINPYANYDREVRPFLFDGEIDDRYPAMERVVGVTVEGTNKAYPFSVLKHEPAVNDEVGGVPIVAFWGAADTASALDAALIAEGRGVGVGIAYQRVVDGRVLTFEALEGDKFRDRESGSTWDLLGAAIAGPLRGEELVPVAQTNHLWFAWAAFNSGSAVYTGGG